MQQKNTVQFVNKFWKDSVIPALSAFVRIPSKSPAIDSNWEKNGYLLKAAELMAKWASAQKIPGLKSKIIQTRGRSPLLYVEIPGQAKNSVLFYGHLDKMPEAEGWNQGLGPWKPVIKNNRLYGRGTADDGYAFFSTIAAIKLLVEQKKPYSRCVIIIESGEESGSPDFLYYLKQLRRQIGNIDIAICLDAPAGDYQRLWRTTSTRGIVQAILSVEILKKAVHSGHAGGMIATGFCILRQLLSRIENENTGKVLLKSCALKIPKEYRKEAKILAHTLGKKIYTTLPLIKKTRPLTNNLTELVLNRYWRSALSIIGVEGLPQISGAGNLILPKIIIKLTLRIPPNCNSQKVAQELQKTLTANPPHGATLNCKIPTIAQGWAATKTKQWLTQAINQASKLYFGAPPVNLGDGGNISTVAILTTAFPKAQLILTGVSAPDSNEHGANESLYLPAAQKLTCCLAHILAEHYIHAKK